MYGAWKEAEEKRADEEEGKSKLFHFLRKKALYPGQSWKCDRNIRIQTEPKDGGLIGIFSVFVPDALKMAKSFGQFERSRSGKNTGTIAKPGVPRENALT
jgi:hypothetical protein